MDFTIAVKLIAKDVREQDRARPDFLEGGRHGRLVHLEDADVGIGPAAEAALRHDRRHEAGDEVRARPIVERSDTPLAEDVGDQTAGCRLAVGAGYEY